MLWVTDVIINFLTNILCGWPCCFRSVIVNFNIISLRIYTYIYHTCTFVDVFPHMTFTGHPYKIQWSLVYRGGYVLKIIRNRQNPRSNQLYFYSYYTWFEAVKPPFPKCTTATTGAFFLAVCFIDSMFFFWVENGRTLFIIEHFCKSGYPRVFCSPLAENTKRIHTVCCGKKIMQNYTKKSMKQRHKRWLYVPCAQFWHSLPALCLCSLLTDTTQYITHVAMHSYSLMNALGNMFVEKTSVDLCTLSNLSTTTLPLILYFNWNHWQTTLPKWIILSFLLF